MNTVVWDLYSEEVLEKLMEPVFHSYYHVDFREGFYMLQSHSHPRVEIMYARKGSCEVYADNERYRLEVGDFIFINGEVPHRLVVDRHTPCRVLCLEFDFVPCSSSIHPTMQEICREVPAVREFLKAQSPVFKTKDTLEAYTQLVDIFKELEQDAPGCALSIRYSFGLFLIKLARLYEDCGNAANWPADQYIKKAIAFIQAHYPEEIGVTEIAAHVKLNTSYLHRVFKQMTGETPMEYLNRIRINKAKLLLKKSDIPIIEICSFVGYNSRQYFTYAFKKSTGMTPKAYKQKQQTSKGPGWHTKIRG